MGLVLPGGCGKNQATSVPKSLTCGREVLGSRHALVRRPDLGSYSIENLVRDYLCVESPEWGKTSTIELGQVYFDWLRRECLDLQSSALCSLALREIPVGDLATVHEYGVAAGLQPLDDLSKEVDPVSYA
jgi:hypothetical protein